MALQGERWQVQGAAPLQPGQQVRVTAREGVHLQVSAVDEPPPRGGN
ncbi:NfeD family protein [Ectopseudomonas hydrolytica]